MARPKKVKVEEKVEKKIVKKDESIVGKSGTDQPGYGIVDIKEANE